MRYKRFTRIISVYLEQSEYEKLMEDYKATIYRSKASYLRKLVLGQPVAVIYRNRSLDDFIETAVKLRKGLKALLGKEAFTPVEKEELKLQMNVIEETLIKIVTLCNHK